MTKTWTTYFLYITLSSFTLLHAQSDFDKKWMLSEVLQKLESTYQVSFSYADDTVLDQVATLPDPDLSLQEALQMITAHTSVNFEILNSTFIAVKPTGSNTFTTQNLNEVLVTNYLTTGISLNKQGDIRLYPETFGILPGLIEPDVFQTIQAFPSIISADETVSNINVRGGTHDQNLILWEGIKMYQSGHFFGMISAFNPYSMAEVDLYKNGSSAQFGDGVSSVMDMKLTQDLSHEFRSSFGINMTHVDGYAEIPLGNKTHLIASGRRALTDALNTPTYRQYFDRVFRDSDLNSDDSRSLDESFYFYDTSLKVIHQLSERDQISIYGLAMKNHLDYQEQSMADLSLAESKSELSQKTWAGGLTYSRNWNQKWQTEAEFYSTQYDLDATNFDVANNQQLIQENQVRENALKIYSHYKYSSKLKLSGGYQFLETGISNLEDVNNPDYKKYVKEVMRSHSIYVEGSLESNNRLTYLKPGLRLNYLPKFDRFLLEPRLRFGQRFLNYFRLEVLGEMKSQTSSQIIDLQQDFLGVEKRRWVLANETNIPIITSKQLSAGIHYHKNHWLLSTEAFLKHVDGITTRSQGFQNQYQFVNATGTYQVKGVDVLINKKINRFSTWLSYTYSVNNYHYQSLNDGGDFANNVDIRHQLNAATTYSINGFKVALGVNWHSGEPYTSPVIEESTSQIISYHDPNAERIDDYLRLDFSTSYSFEVLNEKKAFVGLSIWNVLNRENILNKYYIKDALNNTREVNNVSLAITPNISFRLNL